MPYLKFNTTESRYTDYQFKPLTEHLIQINGIKEYTLTGFKLIICISTFCSIEF